MLLLAGLALASGCTPFQQGGPATREYVLEAEPTATATAARERLPQSIEVAVPVVPPGLDGTAMRVRRPGQRLDHIADSRWAEPLPRLLQRVLRDTLRDDTAEAAGPTRTSGGEGHTLRLRVERFYPVYGEAVERPPRLEVALTLALVEPGSGRTVAAGRGESAARAEANRVSAIVTGLQGLLNEALGDALDHLAGRAGSTAEQ